METRTEINKQLPPSLKRYICTGVEKERMLYLGYPIDPENPKGMWQGFAKFPVSEEQQDKVEFQKIYLQEEVEIREVDGKKIAFIKSLS